MPITQKRLLYLFAALTAWAVIVIARLVQIQIVRHGEYVVKAARQQERTLALQPVRGSIVDRHGGILAESVAAESIYADPQAIGDRVQTAKALAGRTRDAAARWPPRSVPRRRRRSEQAHRRQRRRPDY